MHGASRPDRASSFALGSILTLVVVLVWDLLQPTYEVEMLLLEVARQALQGTPAPP